MSLGEEDELDGAGESAPSAAGVLRVPLLGGGAASPPRGFQGKREGGVISSSPPPV